MAKPRIKRAVILHGTNGHPDINWLPWAKQQLEKNGYRVWVPELPENHSPNRFTYEDFLRSSGWDFRDNLVIGHSSGATTALNLLNSDWFPPVERVILVGTFLNENKLPGVDWYKKGQFDQLFPENFDINKIKKKAKRFILIHGDDDPYCSYEDAINFCQQLNGEFVGVVGGLHLSSNRKTLEEMLPFVDS